ncbi:DUF1499 domain-containing protein [Roseivivax marinus]|jgi:uncharacterized protein (DUF1499 family)|uniref:DUF1499 domain-containing protein n=1 Tax=Roseivivax marinus TaxID=1379903 RepID=UPI0008AB95F4|nr:DUF1499 domain-containing protein [Roseivivax marinus]UMA66303.1 DUF1499 domain-containing protein [Roseivivax marinus]SEL35276.1 Protein of unknown function [Roseivivax marinus]
MLFWLIVLVVVGGLVWIRFAPSDPDTWHVDPQVTADQDLSNGVRRRIPAGADTLDRLNGIILATPRTDRLAGSVDEGRVTYVTRSKWMGFPDYTTIEREADEQVVELWARARFGKSDMGVNRGRVDNWLSELRAGDEG